VVAPLGGGTAFQGEHINGDLLVISDFSNGGTTSTITVYKWDTSCSKGVNNPQPNQCGDANLRLLATSAAAKCGTTVPANGDKFCGIVNPGPDPTDSPWSFTDKSGNSDFLNGEFFEGGINLTQLPGVANECFAAVASETRSSTSTTAVLKDFVLGDFGTCGATLSTTPSRTNTLTSPIAPGTSVTDMAVVTGSGTASPPNPTSPAQVVFSMCGPIPVDPNTPPTTYGCDGSDAAHTVSPTPVSSNNLVHCTGFQAPVAFCTQADAQGVSRAQSAAVNPLAAGVYCFKATWAGDDNYKTALSHIGTAAGSECFRVQDTSSLTTDQNWLPNDSATVVNSQNQAVTTGSVTFKLYSNGTYTAGTGDANVIATFANRPLNNSGVASTDNSTANPTYVALTTTTVSWSATYNPPSGSTNITGSTGPCETSTVTINNNDPPTP
jgi:hypothetical protein